MRRNRRMTYRPSKSQAVFGGVVGILFVLIGLFVAIPTFGPFGILWTLIARRDHGHEFLSGLRQELCGPRDPHRRGRGGGADLRPASPQARLEQLRALYDQRLITQEEYEQKRKEILNEL